MFKIAAAITAVTLAATPALAETPKTPVMIGYVAAFRDMKATMQMTDLKKLTHLNLSFINPGKDGSIRTGDMMSCVDGSNGSRSVAEVREIVDMAHAGGVKILPSLGGGILPGCSGDWVALTQPAERTKLVSQLLTLVDEFGFDGIDVDLEWDVLTAMHNAGTYVPFIEELRVELDKRGKLLTCATASSPGGMVPAATIPHFDYINLMSYDQIGMTWGKAGDEHSTMAAARKDIQTWRALGATKEQIVLGIPFYGYGFNSYKGGYAFHEILTQFGPEAAEKDLIGEACAGCNYVTYNGRPTIRAKAKLAAEQTAGLMIWELSEDAPGPNSLLDVAHDSLHNPQ